VELNAELQGEQVWITVQDNGCGIPAELLEEIRSAMADAQEPSSRFFALVNISLLLKLRYGEKAEIYIDSTPGEGTKVSLILPVEGEA
jgi:sensor histidine kinase YesM